MYSAKKNMKPIGPLMKKIIQSTFLIGTFSTINTSVAATPSTKFEVEAGAEYDSNLSIIELDRNVSAGDWAAIANTRLSSQWQATDKVKLKGGASYNSKTYQEYSAFDLAVKQAYVVSSYNFAPVTLGFSYHYADAELDDKDFLTLQQRSLYASRLINQTLFLRAALNDQDKDFPVSHQRNANNHNITGDTFFFFNQGKTSFTLGLMVETEDAIAGEFDYDGTSFRTGFSHQFSLLDKKSRFQLSWRYDQRNYSAVTPAIEAKRNDERSISALEWQLETNSWLSLVAKVEHGNYDSNLAAVDYSETTSLLMLKASF